MPSIRRFVATLQLALVATLALPTLAGCGEEPAGPMGAAPSLGFGAGFTIGEMEMTYRRLVGAEALQFSLTIEQPIGRLIKAYGIKTPYEETVRPIKPSVPMAIRQGKVHLHLDSLTRLPRAGEYPLEVWLINENGTPSNRVVTSVFIQ
ncbi:hypothetical protein D3C72_918420 [compost metagenome]